MDGYGRSTDKLTEHCAGEVAKLSRLAMALVRPPD
jgi:hypothetical protein